MIEKIAQDRRPSRSLITLIESVGCLLRVPFSKKKSAYKAPNPSNYDQTLQLLLDDFYGVVRRLALIQSADLDNEVALRFYNKMLEPGFDYEDATDSQRVPVRERHVAVLVNGTQAAQVALDTAAHFTRHGTLQVIACSAHRDGSDGKVLAHLQTDLERRCRSHFKLLPHTYKIHSALAVRERALSSKKKNNNKSEGEGEDEDEPLSSHADSDWIALLHQVAQEERCETVAVGLADEKVFETLDAVGSLAHWATWVYRGDAVLAKSVSLVRPFTAVSAARRFVVLLRPVHFQDEVASTFLKALRHVRPEDELVALAIFPAREPVGDNRELALDFGARHSAWLKSDDELREEANRVGWNDHKVEEFTRAVEEMMSKAFLSTSRVRIERETAGVSVAETLARVAFEESAAALLLRLDGNKDVVVQAVRDTPVTVVMLK